MNLDQELINVEKEKQLLQAKIDLENLKNTVRFHNMVNDIGSKFFYFVFLPGILLFAAYFLFLVTASFRDEPLLWSVVRANIPEDMLSPTQLCERRWDELSMSCCGYINGLANLKKHYYEYDTSDMAAMCCRNPEGKPSLVKCYSGSVMNCEQFKSAKDKLWGKDGACYSYFYPK